MRALVEAGAEYVSEALREIIGNMEDSTKPEYLDALRVTVKLGSDTNADIGEIDPLHMIEDRETMDMLVRAGVDIDALGSFDATPLNYYMKDQSFPPSRVLINMR